MPASRPSSATQGKLRLNGCWRALRSFLPDYAPLPVQGSLRAKGKKVLENRSGLLSVALQQPGLCQQGWEGCAARQRPQPATAVGDAHRPLAPGPGLGSQPNEQHRQIFADLQSHSNAPDDPPDFSGSFRAG